ncbi:hypothetical protein ACFV3T_22945, partial [Streptomyces albidoflavus]
MTEFPVQSGDRPAAEAPDDLANDPRLSANEPVSPSGPLRVVVVSAGLSVPSSTRLLADRLGEAVARGLGGGGVAGGGVPSWVQTSLEHCSTTAPWRSAPPCANWKPARAHGWV